MKLTKQMEHETMENNAEYHNIQNSYEDQLKLKEFYSKKGLYDQNEEHANCGVGLIVNTKGKPQRKVIDLALNALCGLNHRGAVASDGRTGDGAGIQIQIDQDTFHNHVKKIGHIPTEKELIAVGMIFLPRKDEQEQETCRGIVEQEILNIVDYNILGWRHVPVNTDVVGSIANLTRPTIEQILIQTPQGKEVKELEKDLFLIRRRIEKRIILEGIKDFYVCSLSSQNIVYKGMLMATELETFFPDLSNADYKSAYAIYHQRYSTNTFPNWQLAQPFRCLAHNGEINTLSGNINWTSIQEHSMKDDYFKDDIGDLLPFIQAGSSDTSALDSVFEALVKTNYSAPQAKATLIPKAYEQDNLLNDKDKAMFKYNHLIASPWDGPASLCASDGEWVIAGLDRNGLRPLRAYLDDQDILFVGSETGLVDFPEESVVQKFAINAGGLIGVNLNEGKFYPEDELFAHLSSQYPYEKWVDDLKEFEKFPKIKAEIKSLSDKELIIQQKCFAITVDNIKKMLNPMANVGVEPLGSQGDDTPLAVLSENYRGLHHFFRQSFSQVTNPPIDPIREKAVMSLKTRLGIMGNLLKQDQEYTNNFVTAKSPVFDDDDFATFEHNFKDGLITIQTVWNKNTETLSAKLDSICHDIVEKIQAGYTGVILSDEFIDEEHVPIPMILVVGAVHAKLKEVKLRDKASIHVKTSEMIYTHYLAVLIGVGASTVYPWLALQAIRNSHEKGMLKKDLELDQAIANYKKSLESGLLKIMSKLGISIIASYRGGCPFEVLGLSRSLVNTYFPALRSPISGIGVSGLEELSIKQHKMAYENLQDPMLAVGTHLKARAGAENKGMHNPHAYNAKHITLLQKAITNNNYNDYKKYTQEFYNKKPINLRDLLSFNSDRESITAEEIEPLNTIRKRFVVQAMSHGALSREAHETLAIAMNRIGAKSSSGEGGESTDRFTPYENGDNANSKIKQVASGRFGVTAEYLNSAEELEIKVAQGAKPGEGGQLPGFKVTLEIAKLRHATPGVSLISPPPHHDVYSIEDLAQLIYDLKQINPTATVCVKLTSRIGIGTITAGVAKAGADTIVISGSDGGTGASPQGSIFYAGMPWEMGLASANQVLTMNALRHKVKLRVDGGIRTGRDIVIGAMLGAEEFGLGTIALIAMGCQMLRQCHTNTCPFGICTQKEDLRAFFKGKSQHVINLVTFMAQEVEEILAELGYTSIEEIVGRADLLSQVSHGNSWLDNLDLNPIIATADSWKHPRVYSIEGRNELPTTLDHIIFSDIRKAVKSKTNLQLALKVKNIHRSVGTKISSYITRKSKTISIRENQITLRLDGSAGQSLGAFATYGLKLEVYGDANDYVGKGLSGATIIIKPPLKSNLVSGQNTIIGNTAMYGATSGKLMANGKAGERFCVRNSGGIAIAEGCGNNGCEYMTGGVAIILGEIGSNFGAGMSGGLVFIYDKNKTVEKQTNSDTVIVHNVEVSHYQDILKSHLEDYLTNTQSSIAFEILNNWNDHLPFFKQLTAKEMLDKLDIKPF